MTWVRVQYEGSARVGWLDGAEVVLSPATDLFEAVAGGEVEGRRVPLAGLGQLPILDTPASIRDFMSFEQHVTTLRHSRGLEVAPVWFEQPSFYFSNPAAVIGPLDSVAVSPGSVEFDYELEVAAIIGRAGSDIAVEDAAQYVVGYVLLCDWSARDLQLREYTVGLGPAKGKDGATTIGSHLITPDEWAACVEGRVPVVVSVNGRVHTSTVLQEPYWSFPQMIAYGSRGTRLRVGDVIGSGTIGTGCLWELRSSGNPADHPWLTAGDLVEIEAGPLGQVRTPVLSAPAIQPLGEPAGRVSP